MMRRRRPQEKRKYVKPTVSSERLEFRKVQGYVDVAHTSHGRIFRKSYFPTLNNNKNFIKTLNICIKLSKAGVRVCEPFLRTVKGKTRPDANYGHTYYFDRGEKLPEVLRQTKDPEKRRAILEDVAEQIAKMHIAGIEHNDLHNGNIVVDKKTLKSAIVDFNIAEEMKINLRDIPTIVRAFGFDIERFIRTMLLEKGRSSFVNKREFKHFLDALVKWYNLPQRDSRLLKAYLEIYLFRNLDRVDGKSNRQMFEQLPE